MNGEIDGGAISFCRSLLKHKLIGPLYVASCELEGWGIEQFIYHKIVGKASAGDMWAFALWLLGNYHNFFFFFSIFQMDQGEAVILELLKSLFFFKKTLFMCF